MSAYPVFRKPKPVKRFTFEDSVVKQRKKYRRLDPVYYSILRETIYPHYFGSAPPDDVLGLLVQKFGCPDEMILRWWRNHWMATECPDEARPVRDSDHEYILNWIKGLSFVKNDNSISGSSSAVEPAEEESVQRVEQTLARPVEIARPVEAPVRPVEQMLVRPVEPALSAFRWVQSAANQQNASAVPNQIAPVVAPMQIREYTFQSQLDLFRDDCRQMMDFISKKEFSISAEANIGTCIFCKPIHPCVCISMEGLPCCINCKDLILMMHLQNKMNPV